MSPSLIDSSALSIYDAISKSSGQMKADGYAQLSLGKRHLLVSDIPEAVSALALACELLAKQFGETDAECAEAYFYYGKALLEMSRLESGVLGNALEGMPEGGDVEADSQFEDPEKMTPDEKSEVEAKVKEALDFNYQTCEVELKKAEEVCDMEAGVEEFEGNPQEDSADEAMVEESGETVVEKAAEGDEEPSNLEHAWEMLELAKLIYSKLNTPLSGDAKVNLDRRICEVYLLLGEVSLENENFTQAVEDLTTCLARRQASLPSDSRSIAETLYQLGVAQAFSGDFNEAETRLTSAIDVLKTRVCNLQKMESSEHLTKEIFDLEELIKEIDEKLADHNDMKVEASKTIKQCFSADGAGDAGKTTSNIAVKRKEEVACS